MRSNAEAGATAPVEEVTIADPSHYWVDRGYVPMIPPIHLPSRDGKERIEVWLRVPPGAVIRVTAQPGQEPTLSYPPDTVAERIDLRDPDDRDSISDVRGTRFVDEGEIFHVYRRVGPSLSGFAWWRGDPAGEREATDRLLQMVAAARGRWARDDDPALIELAQLNHCEGCHLYNKPERRLRNDAPQTVRGPNRATDAGGLFVIASVLKDTAPLETHRAREMNVGTPLIEVHCVHGPPRMTEGVSDLRRHYTCDDDSVPYARLDLPMALAAEDLHARAVCTSRAYLAEHMDDDGRASFATALRECGLSVGGRARP